MSRRNRHTLTACAAAVLLFVPAAPVQADSSLWERWCDYWSRYAVKPADQPAPVGAPYDEPWQIIYDYWAGVLAGRR
jgi:hypothetical protein